VTLQEKKIAVISVKVRPSLKASFQRWCWDHHLSKNKALETMIENLMEEKENVKT
jgi:hypothetical protein